MKVFIYEYKLKSLNKEPTCFKIVNKPSCTNHSKFMTKELSEAIMLETRFSHQFLKMKTPQAKVKYNK